MQSPHSIMQEIYQTIVLFDRQPFEGHSVSVQLQTDAKTTRCVCEILQNADFAVWQERNSRPMLTFDYCVPNIICLLQKSYADEDNCVSHSYLQSIKKAARAYLYSLSTNWMSNCTSSGITAAERWEKTCNEDLVLSFLKDRANAPLEMTSSHCISMALRRYQVKVTLTGSKEGLDILTKFIQEEATAVVHPTDWISSIPDIQMLRKRELGSLKLRDMQIAEERKEIAEVEEYATALFNS